MIIYLSEDKKVVYKVIPQAGFNDWQLLLRSINNGVNFGYKRLAI